MQAVEDIVLPTKWTPDPNIEVYRLPSTWKWHALSCAITENASTKPVVYAAPNVWQLELLTHAVARSHELPLIHLYQSNLRLLKQFSEQAGVGVIVADEVYFREVVELLNEINYIPDAILIITPSVKTDISTKDVPCPVIQDVHLFPGLSLFHRVLSEENVLRFIKNPEVRWNDSSGEKTTSFSVTGCEVHQNVQNSFMVEDQTDTTITISNGSV